MRSVRGRDLRVGMVMALPFGKTGTVEQIERGRKFMRFWTIEYGSSRMGLDDEVLIEGPGDE